MGFSGQYVTGVWFGNDNYSPTNKVTGGSVPAEAWHDYMSRAHLNPDIPQIPGLPIHPNQIAYVKRLKEQRQADPGLGSEVSAVRGLSKKTEETLELIAKMMKDAKPLEPTANRQRAALEPVVATQSGPPESAPPDKAPPSAGDAAAKP
jgi:penicillin-binding protein 1A